MSVDLLLDTHVLLWFLAGDERAMEYVGLVADDDSSTLTFSAVSLAELAVKVAVGKLELDVSRTRERARSHRLLELPFTGSHAEALANLHLHHRDPFDRMLIAQAMAEDMTMATADQQFARYDGLRIHQP